MFRRMGNAAQAAGVAADVGKTVGRSSGGTGILRRRSTRMAMGGGALFGAYKIGQSSGAQRNSLVPPSTGTFGV